METLGHLCQACHPVHFDPSILSVLIHKKDCDDIFLSLSTESQEKRVNGECG